LDFCGRSPLDRLLLGRGGWPAAPFERRRARPKLQEANLLIRRWLAAKLFSLFSQRSYGMLNLKDLLVTLPASVGHHSFGASDRNAAKAIY